MPFSVGKGSFGRRGKRTIPQLELDAASDAVLMARVVKRELGMEDCMCIFWTDSSAVSLSLQADRKQFPVYEYFKNRLARIQEYTSIHDWMYVPTKFNPADQVSRGATAAALLRAGTWLNGPEFLIKPPKMWPDQLPQHQNMVNVYQVFNSDVNQENAPISITAENAVDKIIAYFSTLYR